MAICSSGKVDFGEIVIGDGLVASLLFLSSLFLIEMPHTFTNSNCLSLLDLSAYLSTIFVDTMLVLFDSMCYMLFDQPDCAFTDRKVIYLPLWNALDSM